MDARTPGYEVIDGNLLDFHASYIAHQCNCTSKGAKGLAKDLFAKFPQANVYARRKSPSSPGMRDEDIDSLPI
jgi:O-acetyl-ADP-ribose deacetylase (regulator of RNase III)